MRNNSAFYPLHIFRIPQFETAGDLVGLRTLRTLDTSDPRQFGTMSLVPKCLTFFCRCRCVFGTLRHQCRTVSTFYEGAEVSVGHFGPFICLGQIGGAFLFLYRFTTSRHICTIHRDLQTASQDILYIRNHTRHSHLTHNAFQ